jgi:hypothetical protein
MKQLNRSECAILPLVLKGKWYDMIASGEKKEEYRDRGAYWHKRIHSFLERSNNKVTVVSFARGYKKATMFFKFRLPVIKFYSHHPEWGEPERPHYVISLGERVEIID